MGELINWFGERIYDSKIYFIKINSKPNRKFRKVILKFLQTYTIISLLKYHSLL